MAVTYFISHCLLQDILGNKTKDYDASCSKHSQNISASAMTRVTSPCVLNCKKTSLGGVCWQDSELENTWQPWPPVILSKNASSKILLIYFPEGRIRIKRETGRAVNKQGFWEDDQPPKTVDSDRNMKNMLRQYLVPGGKLCNISDFKLTDGYKVGHRDIFEKILSDGKKLEKPPKFLKMFVQVDSQLKIFTKPSYTMDCY